jgi:hypothetical protein
MLSCSAERRRKRRRRNEAIVTISKEISPLSFLWGKKLLVSGRTELGLWIQLEKYQECFKHGNPGLASMAGHICTSLNFGYISNLKIPSNFGAEIAQIHIPNCVFHR